MDIIPHSEQAWLRFLVFPFKAYAVITPLLLLISARFIHTGHSGPAEQQVLLVFSMFPCSLVLLLAAFFFAIAGPKGLAISCTGFGAAAFVIGYALIPGLCTA
jgi:hypothetical protein